MLRLTAFFRRGVLALAVLLGHPRLPALARDAIDAVARGLDRHVPPSAARVTPLLGADGFQAPWNRRERVAASSGLHVARIEHLLRRFGARIDELALVAERPARTSRCRAPTTTWRSRSSMPARTRARCTSTTC